MPSLEKPCTKMKIKNLTHKPKEKCKHLSSVKMYYNRYTEYR